MVLEVDGKPPNKGKQHHLTHINLLDIIELTFEDNTREVCLRNQGLDPPGALLVDLRELNMFGSTVPVYTLTHVA